MKLQTFRRCILATGFSLASCISLAAYADTVHLGKSEVSKEQVISILSADGMTQPKTRGLRLHKDQQAAASETPGVQENIARALSLEVYFEFNSANLTPEAQQQLAPVGEALASSQLAELAFTLEGHTDASGDESYNQHLSELRAQSVKDFFINNYSVPNERVSATGKGESELLEGIAPNSGANRRVTIIAQ